MNLNTTDLIPSISIANLLAQRDAMMDRLREVNRILLEVREIGVNAGIINEAKYRRLDDMCGCEAGSTCNGLPLMDEEALTDSRKRIDAAAWDLLMRESGTFSYMDSDARKAWNVAIKEVRTVELTADNIKATFKDIFASRGEMFENGVIQCFKRLSWNYKTNKPHKFGKRIVHRLRSYGYVSVENCDVLEDLQRAFAILDGKPQEDNRNGLYVRLRTAEDAGNGRRFNQFTHDDVYMSFRVFKNGNAHVTFKRADLVVAMNRILAKHYPDALPEKID